MRGSFSWDVFGRLSYERYSGIMLVLVAGVELGYELASTDVPSSRDDSEERSLAPNVV